MNGLLLYGGVDEAIVSQAKKNKLKVVQSDDYDLPFEKTLLVKYGTRVPWDLLPAAWHFLNKWDAAVPLWRYGVTAADIGEPDERKTTKEVIRDLRVLLYSHELLFVRKNETGTRFINTWVEQMKLGEDKRLAFLRAVYIVKPILCVLPTSWMAEVRAYDRKITSRRGRPMSADTRPLVTIEIQPGRFVKCRQGDEDKVIRHFDCQRVARR